MKLRPGVICGRCGVAVDLPEGEAVSALKAYWRIHDKRCALSAGERTGEASPPASPSPPPRPVISLDLGDVVKAGRRAARNVRRAKQGAQAAGELLDLLGKLFK